MSSKNSIQVAIKVRPLLKREKDLSSCWRVVANSIQLLESQSEPVYFDYIFDQNDSNHVVFDKMAKQIVHSSIQGFNGTIFAYGQTSSGKTYTMMGDEKNPGVMVFAAKEIFNEIEKATDRQFVLRVGYIEIYNEKICDLLNKKNQDLKIHETATGIVSVNCEECIITCEEDLLHYLCMGNKERTVGETNMNERSSRSHAIFRIIVESRKMDRSEDDAITQSVLNLVDLAGSERADQTGARGARLKEGGHINKSLLFLSNVIKRLSENEDDKYISYRDSKLTRILQASLGGNALTSIICTINPTAIDETQSTLNFALRAKTIKNKPQVNEIISDATMMKRLEREIRELKNCLAEERLKNQSQIKVGQLEQRIKNEVLKIINSTSLNNIRTQREHRRRTWCPATTKNHSALQRIGSNNVALPKPAVPSRLQAPNLYLTPLITCRNNAYSPIPSSSGGSSASDLSKEDNFVPGETCDIQMRTPDISPVFENETITLTPSSRAKSVNLGVIEDEFMELQEYTHLENKYDVRHDAYIALKQQVEMLTKRNEVLETERMECIQHKEDHLATKRSLSALEKRCADYEAQIDELAQLNRSASLKVADYEQQLAELKAKMQRLEVENREAVSLEFEFERHKTKSMLRETELLDVLEEKNKEILKLQEKIQCSKDEQDQFPHNEHVIGVRGRQCVKCEDLKILLEENRKVKLDFEKLTLDYEQLQSSYKQSITDAALAQDTLVQFQQVQSRDREECEKLRAEIGTVREKLENVLLDYAKLDCDKNAQTVECGELNKLVLVTKEEVRVLQDKYDKFQELWHEQQQTITAIQSEYDIIQSKYLNLQTEYEKLECTSAQTLEECARLSKENESLQMEITELKEKVEKAQKNLLEGSFTADTLTDLNRTCWENEEELKVELKTVRQRLIEMEKEYNDLSNQLVDSLQEGDNLRNECHKLKIQLKTFQEHTPDNATGINPIEKSTEIKLEDMHCHIKTELCESPVSDSISDSDASINKLERHTLVEGLSKFSDFVNVLEEIEFEHSDGRNRVFAARDVNSFGGTACKLLLGNLQGIIVEGVNNQIGDQKIHMHGAVMHHSFSIVELNRPTCSLYERNSNKTNFENSIETIENLQRKIDDLQSQNAHLCGDNKNIIEEREATELPQQNGTFPVELFEKMSMENPACDNYQTELENLQREHMELKMMFDELQAKVNEPEQNDDANDTLCEVTSNHELEIEHLKSIQIELRLKIEELTSELASQQVELQSNAQIVDELRAEKRELDQRCAEAEADIAALKAEHNSQISEAQRNIDDIIVQMQNKEKEYKDECSGLQLTHMEKLELIESEFRENLRKYNEEWEKSKENYEQTIGKLNEQLESLIAGCRCSVLQNELKQAQEKLTKVEGSLSSYQQIVAENVDHVKQLEASVSQLEKQKLLVEEEKCNLEIFLKKEKEEIATVKDKSETLSLKVDGLLQELHEVKSQNLVYQNMITDYENLERKLQAVNKKGLKIEELLQEIEEVPVKEAEIERFKAELEAVKAERDTAAQQAQLLRSERDDLKSDLEKERVALERRYAELQSSIDEWKFKYASLEESHLKLQKLQSEIESKMKSSQTAANSECKKLRDEIEILRVQNHELLARKESSTKATDQLCQLQKDLAHQKELVAQKVEANRTIRALVLKKGTVFEEEKQKLQGTISCLLLEKKNLEDKLHAVEMASKKFEVELAISQRKTDSINNSTESSASTSPRSRRSLERLSIECQPKTINAGLDDKLTDNQQKTQQIESERKNRRLSVHDERRRQSFWGATRDASSMTDPGNNSCRCIELDKKLQECEKNLFIRESQVTALNMELKNHPLKMENASLKKQLHQEQIRLNAEIRRYKQIIVEQTVQSVKDGNTNAITIKLPGTEKAAVTTEPLTVDGETQTESDLDTSFQKLQSKYNDLKNICRYRYNLIKELNQKIEQKENADGNMMSSMERGQLKAIKTECEAHKNELKVYKQKYEDAKIVLNMRREEIEKLRLQLGSTCASN